MIAVVLPTIRPERYELFRGAWNELFEQHQVKVVTVWDGDEPVVDVDGITHSVEEIMGDYAETIFNFNDGVRNLGFAYVARFLPEVDTIITLDDDTTPFLDTIKDHLEALNSNVSTSWMSSASDYMRGFPYGVRQESPVVVSHGVWAGVPDVDGPTQLVKGYGLVRFYRGPVPRGALMPVCGMNLAFKRCMLPYVYFAPMGHRVGMDRFADIWMGINLKRKLDELNYAMVSGYSTVYHERASNVFKNIQKEARGLELNETYWKGDESDGYFSVYNEMRKRWEEYVSLYN